MSLAHNKRLKAALTEGNGSARDRLSQELPGAVIHEWGSPSNSYSPLLRRVTSLLEAEGGEQGRLERAGKLAGELTDTVGGEDEDLAEFERQETLRQDIDRLRGWVQNAGFSEREAQVYELDMQTNHNTVVIACKLGIDEDTVRGYRKRYRDKIRESRKAAGL